MCNCFDWAVRPWPRLTAATKHVISAIHLHAIITIWTAPPSKPCYIGHDVFRDPISPEIAKLRLVLYGILARTCYYLYILLIITCLVRFSFFCKFIERSKWINYIIYWSIITWACQIFGCLMHREDSLFNLIIPHTDLYAELDYSRKRNTAFLLYNQVTNRRERKCLCHMTNPWYKFLWCYF